MKCPCKNCLIFIQCKQRLRDECSSQVIQLSKTCPYLKEYLMDVSTGDLNNTVIARATFGLSEWTSRVTQ